MNISNIIEQILSALQTLVPNVIASATVSVDSYDVLTKINDADGQDIVVANVGAETANQDCLDAGIVDVDFEIYIARGYGLAEANDENVYKTIVDRCPLYQLRDAVRDTLRNLVFKDETNCLYEDFLRYHGSEVFETPYNLRAATFKLKFKLTGVLPETK